MEVGAVTAPAMRGNRYFFSQREGSQNQPVIYWRDGYKGDDKVLIDPAQLDPSGLTTVEWISPSPDGTAARLRHVSRRRREHDAAPDGRRHRRRLLPLEIPDKTQAPDWLPDGSGFVYQNLKNPKDPYSGQVLFHRMGTDAAKDALLFRQFTKAENEKLATTWGPFGTLSRDGHWLVLGYWIDTQVERSLARRFRRVPQDRQGRRSKVGHGRRGRPGVRHGDRRHALPADDEGRAEGPRRRRDRVANARRGALARRRARARRTP